MDRKLDDCRATGAMIDRRTRYRLASHQVPVALLATKHVARVQQAMQPWPIALDLLEIQQRFIATTATTHLRMERLPALRHEAQQGLADQQDAKRNHGPIPPGHISCWTAPLPERRLQKSTLDRRVYIAYLASRTEPVVPGNLHSASCTRQVALSKLHLACQ